MLIVILAPFVLVLSSLINLLSVSASRASSVRQHHKSNHQSLQGRQPILLSSLVVHIVIHFAADALLVGAIASSLSSVMGVNQKGSSSKFIESNTDILHSSINRHRGSLNEDLQLLVTRAKFRNSHAVQLMDDIHTLFECCGVNGVTDWTKPPYEQSKQPKSCGKNNAGCTQNILRAVAKHRLLTALASLCVLGILAPTQWVCIMLIGYLLAGKPQRKRNKSKQFSSKSSLVKNGAATIA
ncbi:hypothetical protein ACOME3_006883 [Neoechinorhynchus agilis]